MTTSKSSRKQDILDAALRCFNEHGVEATTIDMIRERSGASVGSLYHHFGSKESIAAAIYGAALQEHHECQLASLARAKNAESGVKAVTCAYIDWISKNPEKARFVIYSGRYLGNGEVAKALMADRRKRLTAILGWFQPYIDSGHLKKLPIELYGSLVTGPAHDYARRWLSGRAKADIRAYREIFAEAAWAAVKSDSGKET